DPQRAPEGQRPGTERPRRQHADVERPDGVHIAPPAAGASFGRGNVRWSNGHRCVPPSSGVFGQNHPTIVTNRGTAPYTTPHGVKIDQMYRIVAAMAVRNG